MAFTSLVINYGHFLFRYRNLLFPAVLILLIILFPPYPLAGNTNLDLWMNIAGILIILSGQALRAMVIGLAYIKRGGVNKKIYADHLVKDGIFAHCRNPLYTGNLLILAGFLIIHNNPWVYIFGGLFYIFSYYSIVKAEESFLKDKFGNEFKEYCEHVNRWAINFSGFGNTLSSMQFNWRRVISKDYTTILTWFLTVIFLLAMESIRRDGFEYNKLFVLQIFLPVIFALLLLFVVRTLKKNGRLAS